MLHIADGSRKVIHEAPGRFEAPDYLPDGKFIYYNANTTGTMQIRRMKPDGSGKEQLTFDQYHNWFPHISPNGKWMVFISFPPDIDPDAHPSYKEVMLRLIPLRCGQNVDFTGFSETGCS